MQRSEGPKRARSIPPADPALANVRHELGTPLHQIVGFAELLLMDGGDAMPPHMQEALEAVARSARRLRAVFHEVVALAEAAGGHSELRAPMPAGELVGTVAATLREQGAPFEIQLADATDSRVSVRIPSAARTVLATLAMQLARIFPRAVIRLACAGSDEDVTLQVEAFADALDGSVLPNLLDQSEPPSRRRGLDLASRLRIAIVQELLAAHGGLLRAEGDDGHAAFLVHFEAAEERASVSMFGPELDVLRMRFLAAVGHDLRSPLNAIQGFTDLLLLDDAVTDSARESLAIVQRAAQELLLRIDRMVEWARECAQQRQT